MSGVRYPSAADGWSAYAKRVTAAQHTGAATNRTLTVGGLFSGIGGFSEGFRRAGLRTVWEVEIDPACRRVLSHHDPDVVLYEDVREVGAHNLEPVDIISGGFPCQDVSVAGKRAGLAGERTGLFWEAIRVVAELRPALLVLENVPGLLSSNGGRDFGTVLDALAELGALDIAWRICDAQYWGVAQRRRRVFVVADFRGERAGEILALADGLSGHPAPRRETRETVAGTTGGGAGERGWAPDTDRMTFVQMVSPTIGAQMSKRSYSDGNGAFIPFDLTQVTSGANRQRLEAGREAPCLHGAGGAHVIQLTGDRDDPGVSVYDDVHPTISANPMSDRIPAVAFTCKDYGADAGSVSPTLRAMPHDKTWANGGGQVAVAFTERTRSDGRAFESQADLAYALTNPGSGGRTHSRSIVTPQMAVRRLTPRECARLQGFSDTWLDIDPPLADSAKYRMLGNAVAVPVAEWIAKRIVEVA